MQVLSSTEFRKNIPKYLQEADQQQSPIIVNTRKGAGVFCSLRQWNNLNQRPEPTNIYSNLMMTQNESLSTLWADDSNNAYNDL